MKKNIDILGKRYAIQHCDEIQMGGMLGEAHKNKQIIRIDTDSFGADATLETLLHEVIHIIDQELKLGLSEETVCRLAVGLYSAGYYESMQDLE